MPEPENADIAIDHTGVPCPRHAARVMALRADDRPPPDKVSFYFAAHEDDWQLFMNPSAFQDVIDGAAKTVFVHMTAGDAGLGIGWGGRKHPFYLARENGAETAIRFMADADDIPAERIAEHHVIQRAFDLPRELSKHRELFPARAGRQSAGRPAMNDTGFQSLKRLADGDNDTFAAIDGSTVYHGWSDLVSTLRKIMDFERGRAGAVQLNVAETRCPHQSERPLRSSDDGKGRARCRAGPRLRAARLLTSTMPAPGCRKISMRSSATWKARCSPSRWPACWPSITAPPGTTTIKSFVGRNYFRVQEGAGRCDASTTEIAAARH